MAKKIRGRRGKCMLWMSEKDQPNAERAFEIDYMLTLTINERFEKMFSRSRLLIQMLVNNGTRRSTEVIERE